MLRSAVFAILLAVLAKNFASSFKFRSIMGQTLSSSNFFFYGKKHFTHKGYVRHIKDYTSTVQTSALALDGLKDGVNLDGRVVVITGANSGLGKEVATYSAAKGAKVYMLCRTKSKAEAAREEIIKTTGNDKVEVVLVDVSELEQIRTAAKEIQSKEQKIHALVCNAGVLVKEKKLTKEGYEATFASHLLGGSYLLSKLLIPQVKADEEGRIIFTTSGGMYNFPLPSWPVLSGTDEKLKFDGTNAYAYAKRGQVLLAERWSKEYPEIPIVPAHPGWSDTPAVDEAFGDAKKYLQPLRTPWEGAEGIAWLVGTAKKNIRSGEVYLDRTVQPKHIAGLFYSSGSYTKNTPSEVDAFMSKLQEAAGI
uniref:Dehydrogenase/reductase SDR family member 12 n=1 Tax=Amphora coffeiformis TaxID=265554 RepID=A0A7S3L8A4_9STRA|mmetsp:Transcript_9632/g.19439  ORF Transcript_9632/g.19439 Transcript_9632/m.19439 type:complete len:364 (-) Transcript_9632:37-1128(-)